MVSLVNRARFQNSLPTREDYYAYVTEKYDTSKTFPTGIITPPTIQSYGNMKFSSGKKIKILNWNLRNKP